MVIGETSRQVPQLPAAEKMTAGFSERQGLPDNFGGVRVCACYCDLRPDEARVIFGEFRAFLERPGHVGVRRPEVVPSEKDGRQTG